jgi:hypothetical protein
MVDDRHSGCLVGVGSLLGLARRPLGAIGYRRGTLLVLSGIDAAQFYGKRRTHMGNGAVVKTETVP